MYVFSAPDPSASTPTPSRYIRCMELTVLAKGRPPAGGGAERYGVRLTHALRELGHAVQLVAPGRTASATQPECGGPWVPSGPQPLVAAFVAVALTRDAVARRRRQRGPASDSPIIATTWKMGLAALPFVRRGTRSLVVCCLGREVVAVPSSLRWIRNVVLRRADVLVAISPTTEQTVRRITGRHDVVFHYLGPSFDDSQLPRGTERVESATASTPSKVRILTVCRFERRKNLVRLVHALGRCKARGLAFEARIVGVGETFDEVRTAIRQNGLEGDVSLEGRVADEQLVTLYRHASIFVHPQVSLRGDSDFEGFGLTIADAMHFGVPVVAGDAGGPADFIETGIDGVLVDGMSIDAIADGIYALATDPAEAHRIGRAGRSKATRDLTWEGHALALVNALPERVTVTTSPLQDTQEAGGSESVPED